MENRRILKSVIILTMVLLAPHVSLAYGKSTHQRLTQNIFDQFAQLRGNSFSATEIAQAVQGSFDEDDLPRPENHFYDPINDSGLETWLYDGYASPQWANDILVQGNFCTLRLLSFACPKKIQASDKLFSSATDFSWDRAVYEYVHGSREYSLRALGHQLHLVQDATVPAHTRNDPHEDEDPYEAYASAQTPDVVLKTSDIQYADTIQDAIKRVAGFTNRNFLSKDTIFKVYTNPSAQSIARKEGFGFNEEGDRIVVVKEAFKRGEDKPIITYELDDELNSVKNENWHTLSKVAVANGVAVLDLFLRDVALEKKTNALFAMNKSYYETERIMSALADERDSTIGKLTSLAAADVYELNQTDVDGAMAAARLYGITVPTIARTSVIKEDSETPPAFSQPASAFLAVQSVTTQSTTSDPGPAPAVQAPEQPQTQQNSIPEQNETAGNQEPSFVIAPEEIVQTPGGIQPLSFGGGGVGGGGGATQSNTNSESEEETVIDETPEEPTDITPPTLSLAVEECAHSISTTECVFTTSTELSISWSASDDTVRVEYQGAETTEITATDFIEDNETKTFTVTAYDASDNSVTKTISVHTHSMPVVVNEIAWHGTVISETQDWIELYNRTEYPIDLTDWSISTADNFLLLPLSGVIQAHDYFLIERRADGDTDESTQSPIADISADLWTYWDKPTQEKTGVLGNDGSVLVLKDAHTNTIDEVTECGFNWCAGKKTAFSMERISPDEINDTANWGTNNTYIFSGHDQNGTAIKGTPKAQNSVARQLKNITTDTTLSVAYSPYVVVGEVTIASGTTLTVPAGVVIKMVGGTTSLIVNGTLRTEGTALEPVIFTAYTDDEYGGDTNNDANTTTPIAGNWRVIQFAHGSSGDFAHTVVRYGGQRSNGQAHHGAVQLTSGSIFTAQALTVEHSKEEGIYVESGTNTTLQNATFAHNADTSFGYGIYAGLETADTLLVSDSIFSENGSHGMYAGGVGTYTISNNTFTQNGTALFVNSFVGNVSGNSGSENAVNGIVLPTTLGVANTTVTLGTNTLPYRITTTTTIPTDAHVVCAPNILIQASTGVGNMLHIDGGTLTANDGAVFTSAFASPSLGSWGGIVIKNGGIFNGSNVEVSYAGGNSFYGAGIHISDPESALSLSQSTIAHNKTAGIVIIDGMLAIADSSILHHTDGVGIDVRGGTADVSGITFDDNLTNTNPVDLVP